VAELHTFRIADWDTPLRANPHRMAGRFNEAGSPATQYLALHPLTAWAEYVRNQGLETLEQISGLRLTVWTVKLRCDEVLEVGFEQADRHGLRPDDLVADDWTACQLLAQRIRSDPTVPSVIRTPSAALPGTDSLVVLDARVAIPYNWEPPAPVDAPSSVVATDARPPAALLPLVRRRGDPHTGLEAWKRGRIFEFIEPPRD